MVVGIYQLSKDMGSYRYIFPVLKLQDNNLIRTRVDQNNSRYDSIGSYKQSTGGNITRFKLEFIYD